MKYHNDSWSKTLDSMGIKSFDDWWRLKGQEAESPNTKKGDPDAWSYVTIIQTPEGRNIFLKRQQNFYPNNLLQRWRRQLTYEREYNNYQKIRAANVPSYELIYFSSRKQGSKRQAVYVAEGLDDYICLADITAAWKESGWPKRETRRHFLKCLINTIQHMHHEGILHNALSPRHIFFNMSLESPYDFPDKLEFRLIDFERLKTMKPGSKKAITRDLFSLHRRCIDWPDMDRIWFLKEYIGITKLHSEAKDMIREITNRVKKLS